MNYDIVTDDERTGDLVVYPDPFTDEPKSGLIKSMDIKVSGILKAATKLTEGWTPKYLGNNFTQRELFTADGTYVIPEGVSIVRLVLGQGGQGGQGGHGSYDSIGRAIWPDYNIEHPEGGVHGSGGLAGSAGMLFSVVIPVNEGDILTVTVGAGTLGSTGGAAGTEASIPALGGHTTVTVNGVDVYSSADGAVPIYPFVDVLTGDLYCESGENGTDGADGGTLMGAQSGGSVTYKGITYNGGAAAYSSYVYQYEYANIGGGGAAVGINGNPSIDGDDEVIPVRYPTTANGTTPTIRGADAVSLGSGGSGGHGGGGGGSPIFRRNRNAQSESWTLYANSLGAQGGDAGNGSGGFALIYH